MRDLLEKYVGAVAILGLNESQQLHAWFIIKSLIKRT